MALAEQWIASDEPRQRADGYALRSLLRFDATDEVMKGSAVVAATWWPLLPLSVVYDLARLPGQLLDALSVGQSSRVLASRDIDLARRLGVGSDERGYVQLFGSSFRPVDRTGRYIASGRLLARDMRRERQ